MVGLNVKVKLSWKNSSENIILQYGIPILIDPEPYGIPPISFWINGFLWSSYLLSSSQFYEKDLSLGVLFILWKDNERPGDKEICFPLDIHFWAWLSRMPIII